MPFPADGVPDHLEPTSRKFDVVDAEFTDADALPKFDPATTSVASPERRSRPWIWIAIFWAAVACTVYLTVDGREAKTRLEESAAQGWDKLSRCSYLTSFDGNKDVALYPNGHATLYAKSAPDKGVDGEWRFDGATKRYSLTFGGGSENYSLVEAAQGSVCILVNGNLNAANLRDSWFATADGGPDDAPPEAEIDTP
jgi:hypothetical protein